MNKEICIANGKNKVFYFSFPFFLKTDVVIDVDGSPATNYNLICVQNGQNSNATFSGGEVHFTKPPKSGSVISIRRKLPVKRIVDYQETAPYSPRTHNNDMNYVIEVIKDIGGKIEDFSAKYAAITENDSVVKFKQQLTELKSAINNVDNEITKLNNTGTVSSIQTSLNNLGNFKNDVLDYVVASQAPTAANSYTWYRKYKSGWVEQGQQNILEQIGSTGYIQKTFPIACNRVCYCICNRVDEGRDAYASYVFGTGFRYYVINGANTQGYTSWYACGYAEQ